MHRPPFQSGLYKMLEIISPETTTSPQRERGIQFMEPFERAHQVLHDVPGITESGGTLFPGSAMDMARRSLAGQRQHGLGDQETESSIRMSCMGRIQQHGAGDGCKQLEQGIHGYRMRNFFNAAFHDSGGCRSRKDVMHDVSEVLLEAFVLGHFHSMRVQAQLMQQGRMNIGDVMGMFHGMKANFIGLSVGPTTLNAPTCHPDGKTVRVMIPSIVIL